MESSERELPRYIFEDLLFERRLCRTLNAEQEKLNALLSEQVRLLEARKQLMADVRESVQQRREVEKNSECGSQSATETEERSDADSREVH